MREKIGCIVKLVTTGGTPEALVSSSRYAQGPIIISARAAAGGPSSGAVYYGLSGMASSTRKQLGDGMAGSDVLGHDSSYIDLSTIFIDVAVNGEGVEVSFTEVK
jgi:hypothetical protein